MRNIAANPNVALVFDHYEEHWSNLAYVLVHGHASVVDDREEYRSRCAACATSIRSTARWR